MKITSKLFEVTMIIKFSAKCSDLCSYTLLNDNREEIFRKEGHVPDMLGGGDYVQVAIDLSTGRLLGFEPLTEKEALEMLGGAASEDDEY